ncbi:MAG: helix-turn-helix domain-containing protein [Ardenticatenaceae bacterium]|nr:helix-turn-helix domain-containing protein [Ardenticatenaceae bacterium]
MNNQGYNPVHPQDCNIVKAMNAIGDKWKLLILREAFYGVRRFADISEDVGISPNILSQRLKELVEDGVLAKVPYQEAGQRRRYEYHLTAQGRDLSTVLVALMQWGEAYFGDPQNPPLRLIHRDTGETVEAALVTANGEKVENLREIEMRFWPERT